MPSLLDLVFFKEIEEGLKLINTDSMVLSPGDPPPENAVILGKMPEALIGLLMLYYGAFESGGDTFMKLVKEGNTYSDEQIVAYQVQLACLQDQAKFFDRLFWTTLCREFNLDPNEDEIGYTSDFVVYVLH